MERVLATVRAEFAEFETVWIVFTFRKSVVSGQTLGTNQKNLNPCHTYILTFSVMNYIYQYKTRQQIERLYFVACDVAGPILEFGIDFLNGAIGNAEFLGDVDEGVSIDDHLHDRPSHLVQTFGQFIEFSEPF